MKTETRNWAFFITFLVSLLATFWIALWRLDVSTKDAWKQYDKNVELQQEHNERREEIYREEMKTYWKSHAYYECVKQVAEDYKECIDSISCADLRETSSGTLRASSTKPVGVETSCLKYKKGICDSVYPPELRKILEEKCKSSK